MEGSENDTSDASDTSDDFVPKKKEEGPYRCTSASSVKRKRAEELSTSTSPSPDCDTKSLSCCHCSCVFTTEKIARRHEKGCKKNPNCSDAVFKCPRCTSSFTRKDNLSVHMKKRHPKCDESSIEKILCSFCATELASKHVALRHEMRCRQNPNCASKVFNCPKCHSSFGRKDNMLVHSRKCGEPEIFRTACLFCPLTFAVKKTAERHQKICRKNPNCEFLRFECEVCHLSFSRKENLSSHLKRCTAGELKKMKINCLHNGCGTKFMTKTILIEHLKKAHNSLIDPEVLLTFKSEAEFIAWKEKEEERTFSYYSQDCGDKRSRTYLYCQHDGSDRAHRKAGSADRKTSRKNKIGQIKSGDLCISKMVVVNKEDGSCEVVYYPSHSHELSEHDLAHHPVTDSTNTFINNLIALNVPARTIKKCLQAPMLERGNRDVPGVTKNLVITERRIKQRIARRKSSLRLDKDDATSVYLLSEELQKENYDPVIIYKPVGLGIVVGPPELSNIQLSSDLFMFGLQTKEQRQLFVVGCKKVLVVDDTHNVTQYVNVKLLNIVVVDHNNRGWPAGHFISNCMAGDIVKLFIRAIQLRCKSHDETVEINCLITDDDPALVNGVESGIGVKIRHILCQWHLDNTMKDSIREKAPLKIFDCLYSELKVVINCSNESEFILLYDAYKNKHSKDAPDFISYLTKYYDNRKEKWAMCYRKQLGHGNVNTTGHCESFHNVLKTNHFQRIPNKRMDDLIYCLLNIEKDNYEARLREDILGFREPPDKIRERHERGLALKDDCIEEVSSYMWRVFSSTTQGSVYHISRMQEFCNKDHCFDKCLHPSCHGLCSHIYLCSCLDKIPLCKHIHKLQSLLFRDKPCPTYEDSGTETNVTFFSMNEEKTVGTSQNAHFSEANAYKRLEANLTKLSDFVFKRSIPSHLLSPCDTTVGDLVKRCSILSLNTITQDLPPMPGAMKIAPSQKLKTQLSQLCKFKRKIVNKKKKAKNDAEFFAKREAAKNNLMSWANNNARSSVSDTCEEIDDCEEDASCNNLFSVTNSKLKEIALSIGGYKISFLDLKTISLDIKEEELALYKLLDPSFHFGWFKSEVINAFIFTLSLGNECVYAGCNELALSMSRGNTLRRIFKEEMPDKDTFLFPANFSGDHWTIIAVLARKAEILFMDPRQSKPTQEVMKCVATIIKVMGVVKPSVVGWRFETLKNRYQYDAINCGAYVCWFAHQIMMDVYEPAQLDIPKYREFIEQTLCGNCLKFTSDINVCIVCSLSETSACDDVRCSRCNRLYHALCLNCNVDAMTMEEFVCPEFDIAAE